MVNDFKLIMVIYFKPKMVNYFRPKMVNYFWPKMVKIFKIIFSFMLDYSKYSYFFKINQN